LIHGPLDDERAERSRACAQRAGVADQFSVGVFSPRSITIISTSPFRDSSLRPSCDWIAANRIGGASPSGTNAPSPPRPPPGGGGGAGTPNATGIMEFKPSGEYVKIKSYLAVKPVASVTGRFNWLVSRSARSFMVCR